MNTGHQSNKVVLPSPLLPIIPNLYHHLIRMKYHQLCLKFCFLRKNNFFERMKIFISNLCSQSYIFKFYICHTSKEIFLYIVYKKVTKQTNY